MERRAKQLSRCMSLRRERSARSIAARFDSCVCWKMDIIDVTKKLTLLRYSNE